MFDLRVQRIAVNATANGDNTILAAVGQVRFRVVSGVLGGAGAVGGQFTDGAGGTALAGRLTFSTVPMPIPFCQDGHFETTVGTALVLNLDAAVAIRGWLVVHAIREFTT